MKNAYLFTIEVNWWTNSGHTQSSLNVSYYIAWFEELHFNCNIQEEYLLVVTWFIHYLQNDIKREAILHFLMSMDEIYHKIREIEKYILFQKSFLSPWHTKPNQSLNIINASICLKIHLSQKSLLFLHVDPNLNVAIVMSRIILLLVSLIAYWRLTINTLINHHQMLIIFTHLIPHIQTYLIKMLMTPLHRHSTLIFPNSLESNFSQPKRIDANPTID